jgi:hypothetical protein
MAVSIVKASTKPCEGNTANPLPVTGVLSLVVRIKSRQTRRTARAETGG